MRDIIREIEGQGWYYVRTDGDHHVYHHEIRKGNVVVAGHGRDELKPGTLKTIRRQARGQ